MTDTSAPPEEKAEKGIASTLVALAVVTLMSIAAGAGLAWYGAGHESAQPKPVKAADHTEQPQAEAASQPQTRVAELSSIMTNLSGEGAPWLRLDLSVVIPKDMTDQEAILAQISQDILSFVRTLRADQIAGGSNLQFLKQDLREIAQIRTGDPTVDVLIRTIIVD